VPVSTSVANNGSVTVNTSVANNDGVQVNKSVANNDRVTVIEVELIKAVTSQNTYS
jgi:hypothetical protein